MAKISLAKALKEKNRIAGEINQINAVILREQNRPAKSTSTVDVIAKFSERNALVAKLVALKTAITKANIGIYETLAQMEEAKAEITLYSGLNVTETEDRDYEFVNGQQTMILRQRQVAIKQEQQDEILKGLRKKIADLQDAVDTYNATHKIEFGE